MTQRKREVDPTPDVPRRVTEVTERKEKVGFLYCRGLGLTEIARTVGSTLETVKEDMESILQRWRDNFLLDLQKRQAEELAKVNEIERTAWAAYERSCEDYQEKLSRKELVRVTTRDGGVQRSRLKPGRVTRELRSKGRVGDPRYLDQVAWCIETRMKLFGILKDRSDNVRRVVLDWAAMYEPTPQRPDPINERLLLEGDMVQPPSNGNGHKNGRQK